MELNTEKVITFRRMELIRSKIFINHRILKQTDNFNCLGYDVDFVGERDLNAKIINFAKILGIKNLTFKPSPVPRHVRM
jgi:hypothetical protein